MAAIDRLPLAPTAGCGAVMLSRGCGPVTLTGWPPKTR